MRSLVLAAIELAVAAVLAFAVLVMAAVVGVPAVLGDALAVAIFGIACADLLNTRAQSIRNRRLLR